jgi:hypothetical protein
MIPLSRIKEDDDAIKAFEKEDWDTIARLARNVNVKIEVHSKETRVLKKKIQIVRHILETHLRKKKGREVLIERGALIGIYNLIKELEEHNKKEEHVLDEMIGFLSLLLSRFNKEPLKFQKNENAKGNIEEFKHMKDVVED